MIRVCEPQVSALQARRLSAEEFCALAQTEAGSLYRPHSEVLRMLAAGQAVGLCRKLQPQTALLALPLDSSLSAVTALRRVCGRSFRRGGALLTPPVGDTGPEQTGLLLQAARTLLCRRAPDDSVWAVLEYGTAEPLVPLYIQNGFALRALRPLNSLAPCYLFSAGPLAPTAPGSWLPLQDPAGLALALGRGWVGVESRPGPTGWELRLAPVVA